MGLLVQMWTDFDYSEDTSSKAVKKFKADLDFIVARDYPWLTGELYTVEGELGWSIGHRDDFNDEYYFSPPETLSARSQMKNLLQAMDDVEPDTSLTDAIDEAYYGKPSTKYAKELKKFLVYAKDDVSEQKKTYIVTQAYSLIASRRTPYVLGAARIYRAIWRDKKNLPFILAGLLKLYYEPLTRIEVGAETVRRKITKKLQAFGNQCFPNTGDLLAMEVTV